MQRATPALILAIVALSAMLAGCGASELADLGSTRIAPAAIDLSVRNLSAAELRAEPTRAEWFGPQRFDDTPVRLALDPAGPQPRPLRAEDVIDFSALPPLPPYDAPHAASEVFQLDIDNPAQHTDNASPGGGSLIMTSLPGWTEWAWYTIPLFGGEDLVAVSATGSLITAAHGDQSGLWIGTSNYSLGRWQFSGPYDLSSMVVLNLPDATYADNGGVGHMLVVVTDGDGVNLTMLQYDAVSQGDVALPMEFYTALGNAGLNPLALGITEIDLFGGAEDAGFSYANWDWSIYQFGDPPEQLYEDLHTILPTYWSAWWGSDDEGFFQPADYAQYVMDKGDTLDAATGLQDIFMAAVEEMPEDKRTARQDFTATLAPSDPLAHAIADFVDATEAASDFTTYQAALSQLVLADQEALALVVYAALDAFEARNLEHDNLGLDEPSAQTWFDWAHGSWVPTSQYIPALIDTSEGNYFMRGWPYNTAYFEGAAKICDAIDQLSEYITANDPAWENVSLDVDTDWGRLTIGGTGNDTYTNPTGDGYALLIELGGNDTYDCTAGATASGNNGVSLAIDLAGDDTHVAQDDPLDGNRGIDNDDNTSQQGAGRLGIGIFVDYEGEDVYDAVRMSQGFAMMGVGVLADYGNDADTYGLEAYGQGGAISGIGIVHDDGGDVSGDEFNTWGFSQGYGGVMGIGLLAHYGESSDTYYAEPTYSTQRPEYNSAQKPDENNANFAQGAAFGTRWDAMVNPETSMEVVAAGGYGLLYDQGGHDDYECGIFGTGTGFFHGHGLLIDQAGSDQHTAVRYAQGATAHVALAGLWDGGGEDYYENEETVGIGGAHDLSITWFLERGGNDHYVGAGYAFGCSLNNGFAYFIDMNGSDEYQPTYTDGTVFTLGRGGWPGGSFTLEDDPTYGIFVDVGGNDIYDPVYASMLSGLAVDEVISTPPSNPGQWVRINGNPDVGSGFYAQGYGSGLDAP